MSADDCTKICGMIFPLADLSSDEDWLTCIGRGVTGRAYKDVREHKRAFELTLAVLDPVKADAWARLLEGRGNHFSFDGLLSSDKGLLPSDDGGAGLISVGTPDPKYGTQYVATGDDPLEYSLFGYDTWTVSVWHHDGAAWVLRQQTSDLVKMENGVQGSYAWSYTPTGSGSIGDPRVFSLQANSSFDDLVILPYALPQEYLAQIATHNRAFPALPRIEIETDAFLGQVFTVISEGVKAQVEKDSTPPTVYISTTLREV